MTAVTDENARKAAGRRYRRTLLIFGLAGPYIGLAIALIIAALMIVAQQVTAGGGAGDVAGGFMALGVMALLGLVLAIPIGGIPGLLAGFAAVAMQRRGVKPPRYHAICAVAGALGSLGVAVLLRNGLEYWAAIGASSALICAHLTRAR